MSEDTITLQPSCVDDFDIDTLSVSEAIARINSLIGVVQETEFVTIRNALGRTLAKDVLATTNVPAHTNSAMDGYAINSSDLSHDGVVQLSITGTALAGQPYMGDDIQPGQCVRIMTGAKMPHGTDTVVIQEHVTIDGDTIRFDRAYKHGQNVRQTGEDLKIGQIAIAAGKKLTPAELGMLASMGLVEVEVRRKLRVAFFSTGNELRPVGETLGEGEIYDSNRYTLHGMLIRLQVDILDLGVITDQPQAIRKAFQQASADADIVITTGGVSVGEADYVKDVITELGQVDFWKLAIKPGRPMAFGKLDNAILFGLPGNPVAVMVTFYQFVQPALKHMMGQTEVKAQRFKVPCLSPLKKKSGRTEYYRGILESDEHGCMAVRKAGVQGSGILSSMSKANCFIVLPTDCGSIEPNQLVDVEPFEGLV